MVNVIGLGYIGLPTALMLASHGSEVVGTDYNEKLVDTLNAGQTTFKENGDANGSVLGSWEFKYQRCFPSARKCSAKGIYGKPERAFQVLYHGGYYHTYK